MSDSGIQITHELTIEGYRLTVYEKETGKFILTWLMDPREALEMGQTMIATVVQHIQEAIAIIENGAGNGN